MTDLDLTPYKGKVDILQGGVPCQAFSQAGERKGTDDPRGQLIIHFNTLILACEPKMFLVENVKGLLNHDGGRTFAVIIASLDELGYDVQWEVVNSQNFGVPQNRERVFIVGHLRGQPRPQVFPLGLCVSEDVQQAEEGAQEQSQEGPR